MRSWEGGGESSWYPVPWLDPGRDEDEGEHAYRMVLGFWPKALREVWIRSL